MPGNRADTGRSAIEVAEEAFYLVRRSAAGALPIYYIGSIPFVCGVIFLWAELVRSPFAPEQTVAAAFVLALLFLWMKAFQAAYCQRLYRAAAGLDDTGIGRAATLRMAIRQGFVQTLGLLALPIALVILMPFGWVYALLQSYAITEDGTEPHFRDGLQKAWAASQRWPGQNHLLIWLYSPYVLVCLVALYLALMPVVTMMVPFWAQGLGAFYLAVFTMVALPACPVGGIIAINIGTGIYFVPYLLQTIFGVRTVLTESGINPTNSIFVAVVCGLTYLLLDPLMKACYALRCFHGDAIATGEDLRVALRDVLSRGAIRGAAILLVLLGLAGVAPAQDIPSSPAPPAASPVVELPTPRVSPVQLDAALNEELADAKYIWRTDPGHPLDESTSAFGRFVQSIGKFFTSIMKKFWSAVEWLRDKWEDFVDWLTPDRKPRSSGDGAEALTQMSRALRGAMGLLIAALVVLLLYLVWRVWKTRQLIEVEAQEGAHASPAPDIADEATTAADLPEEAWLKLARELMEKGDYRLAARAYFLATLAVLSARNFIRIVRSKSNMEYARELARYSHEAPQLRESFAQSMRAYEAVWYGDHACTPETCALLERNRDRMAGHA